MSEDNDFIDNVCDDLHDALTNLVENVDNYEEYKRVHELLRLISKKTDDWANDGNTHK